MVTSSAAEKLAEAEPRSGTGMAGIAAQRILNSKVAIGGPGLFLRLHQGQHRSSGSSIFGGTLDTYRGLTYGSGGKVLARGTGV